ncbi:MAG: cytochrome ubiquinol oxidase subunit I [Alphaproteobacteria bacterium]|nr:cytochrome ubiquinol oxidase subunit I [Alphaproteobacteria bacterium]
MDFDTLLLSRIQFAFTVGFHILFPTLTIGLASFLVVLEARWLMSGKRRRVFMQLYEFWVKIFALAFGMGVVSGVVLSYEFGTNFSRFSEITGNVLGPLLSYEVLTAFFLEAGFLGIMLFGRKRVGARLHFFATLMVAIGTIISSFWILSANSWMHTPAGYAVVDGRFVVTDWLAVVFNPSFPYRLVHMLLASYLAAGFVVAAVSAWYLLRRRHENFARNGFSMAMWLILVLAPLQILVGDLHGLNAQRHQPIKVAAMEGLWETRTRAPLVLFAWPDVQEQRNRFAVEIPGGASLILKHDLDGTVLGLDQVPPEDWPNVPLVFFSFRIMVGIGLFLALIAVWSAVARARGGFYKDRWLMRGTMLAAPLTFVATLAGWVVAETGRQPWTVQGLLRTSESVSPIAPEAVMTTLVAFVLVYGVLFVLFLVYLLRMVRKGPDEVAEAAEAPRARIGAIVQPAE